MIDDLRFKSILAGWIGCCKGGTACYPALSALEAATKTEMLH